MVGSDISMHNLAARAAARGDASERPCQICRGDVAGAAARRRGHHLAVFVSAKRLVPYHCDRRPGARTRRGGGSHKLGRMQWQQTALVLKQDRPGRRDLRRGSMMRRRRGALQRSVEIGLVEQTLHRFDALERTAARLGRVGVGSHALAERAALSN